jgi:hypothetical protein
MSTIGTTAIKCFANIGSLVLKFKESTCRQHGNLVRFLSFRKKGEYAKSCVANENNKFVSERKMMIHSIANIHTHKIGIGYVRTYTYEIRNKRRK